jgi:uncharacterized membrane protein YeaQ/YmgE (transglycosylase-associated protein family)
MGIITWIVLGLIAGVLANFLASGGFGLIGSIVLGIVGAVIGGFIASAVFNKSDVTGINLYSIVVAVLGAIGVIVIARLVTQSRSKV